jgi:hypothetical protein
VDVASLSIALVAFVVALLALWLQFKMYDASSRVLNDFRAEMHDLVGELKGSTGKLADAQERQFDRMLGAFVERPSESARAHDQSLAAVATIDSATEGIKAASSATADPELKKRLEAVERQLDAARGSASEAASGYEKLAHSVVRGMSQVGVMGVGRFPVDVVGILENIRRLADAEGFSAVDEALKNVFGPMESPKAALDMAIREWLVTEPANGRIKLTPRADAFFEAVDAERRWRAEHPGEVP